MEKSWENFWTTGKVEDYLTYRNRVAEDEGKDESGQDKDRKDERDSDWKGLK